MAVTQCTYQEVRYYHPRNVNMELYYHFKAIQLGQHNIKVTQKFELSFRIPTDSRAHCSNQGIQWKLIPEQSPHFGSLWEAAIKSYKFHLKRINGDVKVSFEELTMITT